ncbi:la protein 1 isoform X1 [Selaginella moellendorffii]|uniref:la protein 1 n=1 Tax=Selaginella moellendorffii TaxID=88036 RepID=UPI000D1CE0F1|nr:la protein 1 [Selaginella moellendorffii]XP_024527539.1 la protein 1 isoform X1 [Selaginella moellendorffii]|eukprot:XP_024524900.1 la protein 1 [Selaginella moellendorffii]
MENGAVGDDAAAKITRQVEFYFSDSNLANDAFLLRSIEESADGLVSLSVICAFTRMRFHLRLSQTTPETIPKGVVAAVADVLRKSSFLKVSDDGLRVGRVHEMQKPEEVRAEVDARSLAVSPFSWKTTREEIEAFFESNCKILSVRVPRHPAVKAFSGYAIVEFASPEEAQRASGMGLNFKGADLKFQSKDSFETLMNSLPKKEQKERDDYVKGLLVRFKLTKIEKGAQQESEKKAEEEKKDEEKEEDKSKDTEDKDGEAKEKTEKGTQSDAVIREDLKAVFQQYGSVKFVDFSKGETEGYIRFETPEDAGKARTAAVISDEGGLVIKDYLATLEALEGQAERDYWKKIWDQQVKRRETSGQNRYSRDNRARNPGKQDRKFKGNSNHEDKKNAATGKRTIFQDDDDAPEPKLQRTE